MDDIDLPQIPESLADLAAPTEDIPEAIREAPVMESQASAKRTFLLWGLAGLGGIVLLSLPLIFAFRSQSFSNSAQPTQSGDVSSDTVGTPEAENSTAQVTSSNDAAEALLGHLPYEEAPATDLEPITPDEGIQLRKTAAEKFLAMVEAARAEGISLVPLSGFRSVQEQEQIFFELKAERGEVASARAAVSAPPGHSEHHTGYAVDIGDGNAPGADLQFDFEETSAFKWLQENAAFYSFELSFPKGNPMGVSYEPWHWRYVGNRHSLETFYRSRTINSQTINSQQQENNSQQEKARDEK